MEKGTTSEKEQTKQGINWFYWVVIPLPFIVFGISGLLFYAIIEYLHYLIGVLLVFFLIAMTGGAIYGAIESNWIDKEENPVPGVTFTSNISMMFVTIFLLVTMGAWMSYTLHALGIVEILGTSGEPTYGNLVQTYLWHLVNVIPFTNIEKTFGMKDPIVQFTGWIAGLPFLAFRFTVVIIIFGVIREAWKLFLESSEKALWQRLRKR